jgi:hypothetical protein
LDITEGSSRDSPRSKILLLPYKGKGRSLCGHQSEDRFQQLKKLLTNAPILKIADPEKDFLVFTYACKGGLNGVLMQYGQVVCYESHTLNEHEQKYVTHDLELDTCLDGMGGFQDSRMYDVIQKNFEKNSMLAPFIGHHCPSCTLSLVHCLLIVVSFKIRPIRKLKRNEDEMRRYIEWVCE